MSDDQQSAWQQDGEDLLLTLFVQPRSSRNRICGLHEGGLKISLTSPPVDGAANDDCCRFLAKQLGVPRSAVKIVTGERSRHKRLKIKGATVQQLQQLMAEGDV